MLGCLPWVALNRGVAPHAGGAEPWSLACLLSLASLLGLAPATRDPEEVPALFQARGHVRGQGSVRLPELHPGFQVQGRAMDASFRPHAKCVK